MPCASKLGLLLNTLGPTPAWRFLGVEDMHLPPPPEKSNFVYRGDGDPNTQDVWGDPEEGGIPNNDDDLIGAVEAFLRQAPPGLV